MMCRGAVHVPPLPRRFAPSVWRFTVGIPFYASSASRQVSANVVPLAPRLCIASDIPVAAAHRGTRATTPCTFPKMVRTVSFDWSKTAVRRFDNGATMSGLPRPWMRCIHQTTTTAAVLSNEQLVARIMKAKRHGVKPKASQIQVRLVPNPLASQQRNRPTPLSSEQVEPMPLHENVEPAISSSPDPSPPDQASDTEESTTSKPNTSHVVSLESAIQQALEAQQDLVEISLDQDIPVVTIASLSALMYHGKTKGASSHTSANNSASVVKEVTLMVGIAAHDLQRKLADLQKFTSKGHTCTVTVRASRKSLRELGPTATLDRVQGLVEALVAPTMNMELVKQPTINEQGTMGQFQVRAVKRKN